jgi:hypothetical protein
MNDAATASLGILSGTALAPSSEGLPARLRARIATGIEVRGEVVAWKGDAHRALATPDSFTDLTGWECSVNSFHLEDEIPVGVTMSDQGEPSISEEDQALLLRQGVFLALEVCRLAAGLTRPIEVRCIVAANQTNGTFRFHKIRPGENWLLEDLDGYQKDKIAVFDLCHPGNPIRNGVTPPTATPA